MAQLTKPQKEKLDAIVMEKKLFEMVNNFLEKNGAEDLQLMSFQVQPKELKHGKSGVDGIRPIDHAFVFPPICEHGKPMVQRCTTGGRCKWVCNH